MLEIPGHGIPALLHRAEIGTGACRVARVRAALIHAQRLRQLYRPAELHRARRLRHLAKGHARCHPYRSPSSPAWCRWRPSAPCSKSSRCSAYLEVVAAQGIEGLREAAGWWCSRCSWMGKWTPPVVHAAGTEEVLVVHRAGNGRSSLPTGDSRPADATTRTRVPSICAAAARVVAALRREFGQRGRVE